MSMIGRYFLQFVTFSPNGELESMPYVDSADFQYVWKLLVMSRLKS